MQRVLATLIVLSSAAPCVLAQSPEPIASADVMSRISIFSYREGPESDLFLRGTPIAPMAEGEAQVEYQDGNAEIDIKVDDLPDPATLGPYTSYVLWALAPDGRAANQGVLLEFAGGRGELETSYNASQFALIVTAEPHFAVTAPSTMVVLYNVADDVKGDEAQITTVAEQADYSGLSTMSAGSETPPWLVQARYAVAIAAAAGAERFAPEAYESVIGKLMAAEDAALGSRKEREAGHDLAHEVVVASEDARRAALTAAAAEAAEAELAAATSAAAEAERRRGEAAFEAQAAEATRAELVRRLQTALPTRESDRGIVSEIGGVQFASGAADLAPEARESLARFSGIVASYPGLRFNVEGHTDNTGSPAANQTLSLERAIAVRDYLIAQGVPASRIDVAGLGLTRPVAENASEEGRARNRRVEIIISSDIALSAR